MNPASDIVSSNMDGPGSVYKARFERDALPLMGRLLRVARRFTRNARDAEDLVQETYLRAYERFGQFREGSFLFAWMSRILYTQFVNRYHKEARRSNDLALDAEDMEDDSTVATDAAAIREVALWMRSAAFQDQLDERVKGALESLAPNMRDVLILCVVGELRYSDAAEVLDIPIGTVMSRLSRAKAEMRGLLKHQAAEFSRKQT